MRLYADLRWQFSRSQIEAAVCTFNHLFRYIANYYFSGLRRNLLFTRSTVFCCYLQLSIYAVNRCCCYSRFTQWSHRIYLHCFHVTPRLGWSDGGIGPPLYVVMGLLLNVDLGMFYFMSWGFRVTWIWLSQMSCRGYFGGSFYVDAEVGRKNTCLDFHLQG